MAELSFFEVIDFRRWQTIQDYFAKIIGSGVRVISPQGAPLTPLSNPHKYCFEVISSSPGAIEKCKECLLFSPQPCALGKWLENQECFLDNPDNVYYDSCPFSVNRFMIPVKTAGNNVCSYIMIGPVILGKRRTYPEYFNICKAYGLDINTFTECVEHIRVYSSEEIEALTTFFQELTNYIIEISSKNKKGIFPDIHSTLKIEGKRSSFYVDKMLQALFDTAREGLGAERASIMLLDKISNTFSIELSEGISEDIARDTKVRFGEGLAGWVAKEDKVLFIDQDFENPGLVNRLHNPNLKASLMVPIKNKNLVFGVLSLSTAEKKHRFNKENINSVVWLTKLTNNVLMDIGEFNT